MEDIESHKAALRDNNSAATGLTGDKVRLIHFASYSHVKSRELKEKGNAFLKEGKYEEAVEAYSEAINIDDSNVILYSSTFSLFPVSFNFSDRSLAYSKLELWPKAWSDGVKCTNIDPKFGKVSSFHSEVCFLILLRDGEGEPLRSINLGNILNQKHHTTKVPILTPSMSVLTRSLFLWIPYSYP